MEPRLISRVHRQRQVNSTLYFFENLFPTILSVLYYILLGKGLAIVTGKNTNRILLLTSKQPCLESSRKLKPVIRTITFSTFGKKGLGVYQYF